MKRISANFIAVFISLMLFAMTIMAEESSETVQSEKQFQQKDECLLLAKNCGNSVVSIQDKIGRLEEEIARGRAVYTVEELNILKQKLDEVSRTLDFLLQK